MRRRAFEKVKLINLSGKPTEETEGGILKWKFELAPGQEKAIEFEFLIEYPRYVGAGNLGKVTTR